MGEIIFDALSYIFVELIFKGVKMLGLLTIKVFTLSKKSFEELQIKYKGSAVPYLIGLGILAGLIYLIFD